MTNRLLLGGCDFVVLGSVSDDERLFAWKRHMGYRIKASPYHLVANPLLHLAKPFLPKLRVWMDGTMPAGDHSPPPGADLRLSPTASAATPSRAGSSAGTGRATAARAAGSAQAKVTLRVVVSFPRWTHPKAAPAALAAAWARYSRALARHEQGHVDYAVARYPAVVRAIKSATCTYRERRRAGAAEADPQARRRLRQAPTQHGATQGARFP